MGQPQPITSMRETKRLETGFVTSAGVITEKTTAHGLLDKSAKLLLTVACNNLFWNPFLHVNHFVEVVQSLLSAQPEVEVNCHLIDERLTAEN